MKVCKFYNTRNPDGSRQCSWTEINGPRCSNPKHMRFPLVEEVIATSENDEAMNETVKLPEVKNLSSEKNYLQSTEDNKNTGLVCSKNGNHSGALTSFTDDEIKDGLCPICANKLIKEEQSKMNKKCVIVFNGEEYLVEQKSITIGREICFSEKFREEILAKNVPAISRKHCSLEFLQNGDVKVVDHKSTNGTFVMNENGDAERIRESGATFTCQLTVRLGSISEGRNGIEFEVNYE